MQYPTSNHRRTSAFGRRKIGGKMDYHPGEDYGCLDPKNPTHDIIEAVAPGEVKRINNDVNGYGFYVVIEHEVDGSIFCTLSAHLHQVVVAVGQKVEEGQKVGLMGSTGNSTGIHLHFEVRECAYSDFWIRWRDITPNGDPEPFHAIDPDKFFMQHIKDEPEDRCEDLADECRKLVDKLNTIYK